MDAWNYRMKNSVLDRSWVELREQILAHLNACRAAGRPIPTVTLDIEQLDAHTARSFAKLSDGTEFSVSWDVMAAALEEVPCFGTAGRPN